MVGSWKYSEGWILGLLWSSQVLEILGISHNTMHHLVVLMESSSANTMNLAMRGCEMQRGPGDSVVICYLRQWN